MSTTNKQNMAQSLHQNGLTQEQEQPGTTSITLTIKAFGLGNILPIDLIQMTDIELRKMDIKEKHKICLLGDGGTGKTTFITKHLTGVFEKRYRCTNAHDVHESLFTTNKGLVPFQVWDMAGQEEYSNKQDRFAEMDTFLVFYEVSSRVSFKNVNYWINKILQCNKFARIIIVGNKEDLHSKVSRQMIQQTLLEFDTTNIQHLRISLKNNHDHDKPFLQTCKNLLGNDTIWQSRPELLEIYNK
jgi:GTP-binding nuclear protein Ran